MSNSSWSEGVSYDESIEVDMPYGTGLSELEAALDEITDQGYSLTTPGSIISSRMKEGAREMRVEADNWAEKADAYMFSPIARLAGGVTRGVQGLQATVEWTLSGDRKRQAVVSESTDHPALVRYRDDEQKLIIERRKVPGLDKYGSPEKELAESLEEELEELAP